MDLIQSSTTAESSRELSWIRSRHSVRMRVRETQYRERCRPQLSSPGMLSWRVMLFLIPPRRKTKGSQLPHGYPAPLKTQREHSVLNHCFHYSLSDALQLKLVGSSSLKHCPFLHPRCITIYKSWKILLLKRKCNNTSWSFRNQSDL